VLTIRSRVAEPVTAVQGRVLLPFEARQHSRMRVCLESGEYVALILERGKPLRHGEQLQGDDGRVIEVVASPEAVLQAEFDTPIALTRAAFHLGNRHLPVQIAEHFLRTPDDAVIFDLLVGLGARVSRLVAAFDAEGGAYSANHAMSDSGALR
jgi:urease accessory protein